MQVYTFAQSNPYPDVWFDTCRRELEGGNASGLEHFAPEKALNAYELQDFLFCRAELEKTYYADKIVVFGHTPTAVLGGENQILRRETWIDIDCGCAFRGGQLGCLCLDTMEEFYV